MNNFLKISVLLGKKPELVQGAGGNTSVKIGNKLFVKASGIFLKNIKTARGYVCCNLKPIQKNLFKLKRYHTNLELACNKMVEAEMVTKESYGLPANHQVDHVVWQAGKPSIETGLHAVIPSKYVFHTHSVFANILNFAEDGNKIIKKLFPEALIINYKNPGLELAFELTQKLKKNKTLPNTIFLQNHGLITHNDNAQKAYELTLQTQNIITTYLKKQKIFKPFKIKKNVAPLKQHMFPDSVVYSQIDFRTLPQIKKQVYYEICSLINYTQQTIKQLGLKPKFLTKQRVNFLINMEQEKFRIKTFLN